MYDGGYMGVGLKNKNKKQKIQNKICFPITYKYRSQHAFLCYNEYLCHMNLKAARKQMEQLYKVNL